MARRGRSPDSAGRPSNAVGPKNGPSRVLDIGDDAPIEIGETRPARPTTKETTSMMKRVTWFVGGAAAGAAVRATPTKKVKQTAAQISPAQVARSAARRPARKSRDVVDAVREGRLVARHHEDELHAKREGRLESLDDHVAPGDQVFVDGVPVESGRVIVMRRKERQRPL